MPGASSRALKAVKASRPKVNLGYTGHTAEDVYGIIDMGGRQYDPALGRFLQPDIVIQAPENMQSFNRYTYVFNNPFRHIDPSGYESRDLETDFWAQWLGFADTDDANSKVQIPYATSEDVTNFCKEMAVKVVELATPVGSVNDARGAFDQAWTATNSSDRNTLIYLGSIYTSIRSL